MSGGGRTVFFGLIGILIGLATVFVIYRQHQQRLRAGGATARSAPETPRPPPPPLKRRSSER